MIYKEKIGLGVNSYTTKTKQLKKIKLSKFPKIRDNSLNKSQDYVIKQQNPFHFYFRLTKPLKIAEQKGSFSDYSLLLSKLQRRRLKLLKEKVKKIEKEKLRTYFETNKNKIKYKNMIPIPIWNQCEKTYENYKKINKEDKNIFIKKIESIEEKLKTNIKIVKSKMNYNTRNIIRDKNKKLLLNKNIINSNSYQDDKFNKNNKFGRYVSDISIKLKFENQGLNKFIENIENNQNMSIHDLMLYNSKYKLKS